MWIRYCPADWDARYSKGRDCIRIWGKYSRFPSNMCYAPSLNLSIKDLGSSVAAKELLWKNRFPWKSKANGPDSHPRVEMVSTIAEAPLNILQGKGRHWAVARANPGSKRLIRLHKLRFGTNCAGAKLAPKESQFSGNSCAKSIAMAMIFRLLPNTNFGSLSLLSSLQANHVWMRLNFKEMQALPNAELVFS